MTKISDYTCEWFAMCANPAVGVASHPILEYVPICQRCADRFGLEVLDVEFAED